MRLRFPVLTAAAFVALPVFAQKPIRIVADLTEAPRRLYHAEIDLPVKGGEHATFLTPQWIPGTHAPNGPARDITGVVFTANGKTLAWRRDEINLYEFHVDIPAGVTSVHAHLDCIMNGRVSDHIAVLEWEHLMLYPAHIPVKEIAIQPSVTVPEGWGIGTALMPVDPTYDPNAKKGGTVEFKPTTVEALEDSPVIAGEYFHEFALAPDVAIKHYIDVVSDEPKDSNLRPELLAEITNLVHEAGAAYGSHHYNWYHFLLTLSDVAGGEGLEHGQSSDNGVGEKGFADPIHQIAESDLLSHEFTHSWNGKYRRPATLYQPDFATPQVGELLWVYEGMTQYMGNVLAARSGLKTQDQYRDMLAASAASLDYKPGRDWRSTDDTAIASSIVRLAGPWANWRRGQDYYQEGELLWLDVDTLIRQLTDDKKSITDFQHIFLGKGGDTAALIVPYTRQELVDDLNQVVKYDWAKFLHEKVDMINPHADYDGIERGGYKMTFSDKPSRTVQIVTMARAARSGGGGADVWYSLGLRLGSEGTIGDVRIGSPADKAKLAPGQKVIGVNGRVYGGDAMIAALDAAKGTSKNIDLLVEHEGMITPASLDYHEGQKYPVMVRDESKKDYLDEITMPLAKK